MNIKSHTAIYILYSGLTGHIIAVTSMKIEVCYLAMHRQYYAAAWYIHRYMLSTKPASPWNHRPSMHWEKSRGETLPWHDEPSRILHMMKCSPVSLDIVWAPSKPRRYGACHTEDHMMKRHFTNNRARGSRSYQDDLRRFTIISMPLEWEDYRALISIEIFMDTEYRALSIFGGDGTIP